MRPLKSEVTKVLSERVSRLSVKEIDELASVLMISSLQVFNVVRKFRLTPGEAKEVMDIASQLIIEGVSSRRQSPRSYKVSWGRGE